MSFMDMAKSAASSYLGGAGGGNVMGALTQLMDDNGGVGGVLDKFKAAGMSAAVQSWLGSGANSPISAEQIEKVFGHPQIQALAQKFNVDTHSLSSSIATMLPAVIDKLSPGGSAPAGGFNTADIIGIGKSIFGK